MVSFSIDRGGTFTDIYAVYKNRVYIEKLLSKDPKNYKDAPSEGIRRILEKIFSIKIEPGKIDPKYIKWIRMGTTVATNALLERKGAKTALLVTKGFKDILKIGYQNRKELFNLKIEKAPVLYKEVIEIDERVVIEDGKLKIEKKPDEKETEKALLKLKERGIDSLAVLFLHSYRFDEHERIVKKIAQKVGFENISLSSEVIPSIKAVDRGDTTVIDAYLTPHILSYINDFQTNFIKPIEPKKLLFMQSFGGLCEAKEFRGANSLLSGPAGGIIGYAKSFKTKKPLIGFDMGGTSTDVSRFEKEFSISYENEIEGIRIKTPQLEILTTAAGGGSRLFYKNSLFIVGPESSGADPGPVCYKKGGFLSITDANLVLGRINPNFFPKIFGKNQNEPLGLNESLKAFEKLTKEINKDTGKNLSIEEVALGFVDVANEHMIKPIKEVSIQKGYDIREHILVPFGGAGGQHACSIARKLGIKEILIHRYAGILSAVGLNRAQISKQKIKTVNRVLKDTKIKELEKEIEKLSNDIKQELQVKEDFIQKAYLNIRYQNVENKIKIPFSKEKESIKEAFLKEHKREFGFILENEIEIAEIIVEIILKNEEIEDFKEKSTSKELKVKEYQKVYFENGWIETPFFILDEIPPNSALPSPCVIVNDTSTIVVEPNCEAFVDEYKNIKIILKEIKEKKYSTEFDPILLSVFNNLFMSTAEQMGKMFQKTAVSTNIKERLDFSCALFDKEGNLIANAPHIPVHLGSMSYAVKYVLEKFKGKMKNKESFITNAPYEGGSHLPDITVITPYLADGEVAFVVANRGHHADIGGISAGSMPPFSTTLQEEGAVIEAMKIVEDEKFQEEKIREIFQKAGARRIDENISDIKAALSANQKGISLIKEIWEKYSKEVTDAYMGYIQEVSEKAVKKLLDKLIQKEVRAFDFMDDGSKIEVCIKKEEDGFLFDFSDSEIQSLTNQNTPYSVTSSAIVYVLRALLKEDLPLNQGFLKPIKIKISQNSILNPDKNAAVVGGNVTTSQRILDVLLQALGDVADSQGCMNNFSFGDKNFGYYETIGGGNGAGEGFDGADGVHTHMTNTRITDVEIIEERYPVIVRKFQIRENSGGSGKYKGGNGIIREIEFQKDMEAFLLTERRVFSPKGKNGGQNGKRGQNILIRDNKEKRIPSKASLKIKKGDIVRIETPGGGGYGKV